MFSRSAGYAVQALTFLAAQPPGKLTGAREIAAATNIPVPFLWKILRHLSSEKLLRSFKGVQGGYELARPARTISIKEIIAVTPDSELATRCVLGLAECNDHQPCALHVAWKGIRTDMRKTLAKTTLADLAKKRSKPRRK
jgi:Rrf2 family protein